MAKLRPRLSRHAAGEPPQNGSLKKRLHTPTPAISGAPRTIPLVRVIPWLCGVAGLTLALAGCSSQTASLPAQPFTQSVDAVAADFDRLMHLLYSENRPPTARQAIPLWQDLLEGASARDLRAELVPSRVWKTALSGAPDYLAVSSDFLSLSRDDHQSCVALVLALPHVMTTEEERTAAQKGGRIVKAVDGPCGPLVDRMDATTRDVRTQSKG